MDNSIRERKERIATQLLAAFIAKGRNVYPGTLGSESAIEESILLATEFLVVFEANEKDIERALRDERLIPDLPGHNAPCPDELKPKG